MAKADLFKRPSKRLTRMVMDVLNPNPICVERESYSKTPIILPGGPNEGKPCAWVFPRDSTASPSITGAAMHYPFVVVDIIGLYNTIFMKGTLSAAGLGTAWPFVSWWGSTLANAPNVGAFNWAPDDANTASPLASQYLRVGYYCKYTLTNSCNRNLDFRGFKLTPRVDLDGYTYSSNLFHEYCNALWANGIGTDVAGNLTDANFAQYLFSNEYDFFDAPSLLRVIKINKVRNFMLRPGQTKTFIIKQKPRRHWMRRWLNDSVANTGAVNTDCPWSRLKGASEWVFKYTPSADGAVNAYAPYTGTAPDYNEVTVSVPAVATLHYSIKYYCKMMPVPPITHRLQFTTTGQGASAINSVAIADDDYKQDASVFG